MVVVGIQIGKPYQAGAVDDTGAEAVRLDV
jgi:hypothetical protein